MRILLLLWMLSASLYAQEFGVRGQTYPIAEEDLVQYIEKKIRQMQAEGSWKALETRFVHQVQAHLERPKPTILPNAQKNRSTLFDPTFKAPHDVYDTQGKLIVAQGTAINPLEHIQLKSTLLFFNGDDSKHCDWALEEAKKYPQVKLILTAGSLNKMTHRAQQAVYFDLNGFLINKFHIQALPARIIQVGNRLRIDEVSL